MFSNYCLSLTSDPVRFEPLSSVNAVFFDESNKQAIVVRSNGAGGIVVKGLDENFIFPRRIEDRGEISSIKLSPDYKVLSLQRSSQCVEFLNINSGNDVAKYLQTCKSRSSKILGFYWPSSSEIVFVTDKSVEHYQIFPEKMILKLTRIINLEINWFLWLMEDKLCMVSTGSIGQIFYPFTFKNGIVNKLSKYEFEINVSTKECLRQKDFLLVNIYLKSYLISLKDFNTSCDIILYQIKSDGQIRKSNTLKLDKLGKIAINIIDNLIAVHHQSSKTTYLFDIQIVTAMHNGVSIHQPIAKPMSLQPVKLSALAFSSTEPGQNCQLYASSWAIFTPNIILDAKLGCFWSINLNLSAIYECISDKISLLEFLLSRRNSKEICLSYCRDIARDVLSNKINLQLLNSIFERFNRSLVNRIKIEIEKEKYSKIPEFQKKYNFQMDLPVIDQMDVVKNLFEICREGEMPSSKYLSDIIVEYLNSLNNFLIPMHSEINLYLFRLLVNENQNFKLYQYLQYHLIQDSKEIAYELLSLDGKYIPAYQLALDMLKRLNVSTESILEILLSKKQIVNCIRYTIESNSLDKLNLQRCEELAKISNNLKLIDAIGKYYQLKMARYDTANI